MPRTRQLAVALLASGALVQPASAHAAQRWASPSSGVVTGACAADAPCRIDAAVNGAAPGDEVIVAPGTYAVPASLDPDTNVNVHGVAGEPRPWLVGTADLTDAVLSAKGGGTMSHLGLDATAPGEDALVQQGGIAEDLLVLSESGDGAKLETTPGGTVLRESAVRTDGGGDDAVALKLHEASLAGTIHVAGVTALAPAGTGARCQVRGGTASLTDTIVRGASVDVDGTDAPGLCTAQGSDVRLAGSPGLLDGGGNIAADPVFAGPADYRQGAGSPTIDAGVADALLGAADPAGCPRPLGAAPDIGAYEQPSLSDACATAPAEPLVAHTAPAVVGPPPVTGDDDDQGDDSRRDSHDPAPSIGRRVVVAPGRGKIRVRRPGRDRFEDLADGTQVPVGSVVDARNGRVKLATAIDAGGTIKRGTFWGARFLVRQSRTTGVTTLVLRGGDFTACKAPATAARHTASIARRRHRHRVVRSLWARDHHGRFRTHGANSVATARGTAWLTQDRCDGTRTRVGRGAVAVRDLVRHRTVLVRAGHAYLARRRG